MAYTPLIRACAWRLWRSWLFWVCVLVVVGLAGTQLRTHDSQTARNQADGVALPANFFLPERFWSGVEQAKKKPVSGVTAHAALVPHHLIAGEMISRIFSVLQAQGVKRVLIVGPNHYEAGGGNIQFNATDWQTALGRVRGADLLKRMPASSPAVMEHEHSVSGMMPYIAQYLPEAEVASIILKRGTSDAELSNLARDIARAWDKDTVLLASVDFSHYLPPAIAEEKDAHTRRLLLQFNEEMFYTLSNDYLDSPPSVALMIKVCRELGSQGFTVLDHANSADIFSDPYLTSTTSYFTGYCQKTERAAKE